MTPACFDSAIQYEEWRRWASVARVQPRPRQDGTEEPNYCQDCTLRYKAAMQAQGRCGYPNTRFAEVSEVAAGTLPTDFEVVGYAGTKPVSADYVPPKKPAEVRVSLPISRRTPQGRDDSALPSSVPPAQTAAPTAAETPAYTGTSAPPAVAPGTGSEPSQS